MDLIAKVNSYEKLDDYIKMGANAFLFGIKDFSINLYIILFFIIVTQKLKFAYDII